MRANHGLAKMRNDQWQEVLVEREVTYTLEVNGRLIAIENVPARVNLETGEQFFSPDTVERLQQMIWEQREPKRVIQVPVFEFA
jgi:YgiT-type zinc finger domain-containing protein